jgi:hypothetical protein
MQRNLMESNNEEKNEFEELDFNRPDYKFVPNEQHEWRQQGPYIVCKSCEIQHAVFIGMGKLLTGLDSNGKPILKSR